MLLFLQCLLEMVVSISTTIINFWKTANSLCIPFAIFATCATLLFSKYSHYNNVQVAHTGGKCMCDNVSDFMCQFGLKTECDCAKKLFFFTLKRNEFCQRMAQHLRIKLRSRLIILSRLVCVYFFS